MFIPVFINFLIRAGDMVETRFNPPLLLCSSLDKIGYEKEPAHSQALQRMFPKYQEGKCNMAC